MPHMMPMLWMLTFTLSFLLLIFLCALTYFFYLPNLTYKKLNMKFHKWNWVW